jgi:hypothetical protein
VFLITSAGRPQTTAFCAGVYAHLANCMNTLLHARNHACVPAAVLVIDPQLVLDAAQPPGAPAAVRLIVPAALVPRLSAGRLELSDADDPANSYVFGEPAEVFEYTFVGPASTRSGFVSLITRGARPPQAPPCPPPPGGPLTSAQLGCCFGVSIHGRASQQAGPACTG